MGVKTHGLGCPLGNLDQITGIFVWDLVVLGSDFLVLLCGWFIQAYTVHQNFYKSEFAHKDISELNDNSLVYSFTNRMLFPYRRIMKI